MGKKTLMQKLMTIKRDLMANKKEEKAEEDVDGEKKEGEEEVKVEGEEAKAEGEEAKEEETKDELGNEKPKPSNRIKKFFNSLRHAAETGVLDQVPRCQVRECSGQGQPPCLRPPPHAVQRLLDQPRDQGGEDGDAHGA